MVVNSTGSARAIDIEDFTVKLYTINNIEITAFSDDQGYALIEWELGLYRFELSGYVSAEELLKTGLALGLIN